MTPQNNDADALVELDGFDGRRKVGGEAFTQCVHGLYKKGTSQSLVCVNIYVLGFRR